MRMSCHSEAFAISDSLSSSSLGGDYGRLNTPSVWRTNRTQSASKVDGMASAGMDDIEIPAFLRKQAPTLDEMIQRSTISYDTEKNADTLNPSLLSQVSSKIKDFINPYNPPEQRVITEDEWLEEPKPAEASKVDIAMALNTAALHASSFRIALQQTLKLNIPGKYAAVIIDLTKVTKDSATSWALLLEWLFGDIEKSDLLDKHAKRLLRSQLKLATENMRQNAQETIDRNLVVIN